MEKFLNALMAVVEYMWEDEKTDWEECGKPDNHIFIHVRTIAKFMKNVFRYADTHGWHDEDYL